MYCRDCGVPTSYTSSKPKFCSSCGVSFDKTIIVNPVQMQKPVLTKPQNTKKQIQSNIEDNYDDDNDNEDTYNVNYVPNISKIDIEVSEVRPIKIKLRDIVSNLPEEAFSQVEDIKPIKTKKGKSIPKKNQQKNSDFLKQFKAEAGTLRPSYKRDKKEVDG
jgi:uncharacterized Zn finger protein (UPF0148 family)